MDIPKIPNKQLLLRQLEPLVAKIQGVVYTTDELIAVLADFVGNAFQVNVLHMDSPHVDSGQLAVNAEYDPYSDMDGEPAIQLIFVSNTLDTDYVLSEDAVADVIDNIADAVIHETVHMRQSRARDFIDVSWDYKKFPTDKQDTQYYLSHYDEIDAYAHNIADEIGRHGPTKVKEILAAPTVTSIDHSINLWNYCQTFDRDLANPTLRRLLKKVYRLVDAS